MRTFFQISVYIKSAATVIIGFAAWVGSFLLYHSYVIVMFFNELMTSDFGGESVNSTNTDYRPPEQVGDNSMVRILSLKSESCVNELLT